VYFEHLLCDSNSNQIDITIEHAFSYLKKLWLQNNRIKQVYQTHLIFLGMPLLYVFDISNNQIGSINETSLSNHSSNVLFKHTQLLQLQHYYDNWENMSIDYNFTLNFSSNNLDTFILNFGAMYDLTDK
jgi:hypothetical protein